MASSQQPTPDDADGRAGEAVDAGGLLGHTLPLDSDRSLAGDSFVTDVPGSQAEVDADQPTQTSDAGGEAANNQAAAARSRRPVDVPAADSVFGEYELLEEVGRGGMGVIYKARHRRLGRIAALKMILGGRFSSADERQRFALEASAAAGLDHPGIVPVYEIGEVSSQPFFAMKFVDGASLAQRRDDFRGDEKRLRKGARLIATVAHAVEHAHQHGILHRDLKPANILIDAADQPLLTDLGLAKSTTDDPHLTRTGAVLGTPGYMPPEQAAADGRVTTRSDVYALGAMLYELLTGRPPHVGATPVQTVMSVLHDPVEPPRRHDRTIDPELELICLKCLARDPDERYDAARDLADDLDRWLAGEPISLKAPSVAAVSARWVRQHRGVVYLMFAVLLGTLLAVPLLANLFQSQDPSLFSVYDEFPNARKPWFLGLTRLPPWVAQWSLAVLVLGLWPTIGFWNALVTRPASVRGALGMGVLTAGVCGMIFYLAFGSLIIMSQSAQYTRAAVISLGQAVWVPEGVDATQARARADRIFRDLDRVPEERRAIVLGNRVYNEQMRIGLPVIAFLMQALAMFAVPIVAGTVIAHLLLARQLPFWVAWIRYSIGIIAVIGWLLVMTGGWVAFDIPTNGLVLSLATTTAGVILWAVLRWWDRPADAAGLGADGDGGAAGADANGSTDPTAVYPATELTPSGGTLPADKTTPGTGAVS